MLDAKSVVHANPAATPSGAHLAKVWEQLGIADAIKAKVTHRTSLDGGVSAISKGEAEIGLYPVSEIISEKGVRAAGLIPAEVQLNTVYATGVLAANAAPEPAMAFVKFLADPSNAKHWKDAGFEPAKLGVKPPPSCGSPRAAGRPARPARRSPDGSGPSAWR